MYITTTELKEYFKNMGNSHLIFIFERLLGCSSSNNHSPAPLDCSTKNWNKFPLCILARNVISARCTNSREASPEQWKLTDTKDSCPTRTRVTKTVVVYAITQCFPEGKAHGVLRRSGCKGVGWIDSEHQKTSEKAKSHEVFGVRGGPQSFRTIALTRERLIIFEMPQISGIS